MTTVSATIRLPEGLKRSWVPGPKPEFAWQVEDHEGRVTLRTDDFHEAAILARALSRTPPVPRSYLRCMSADFPSVSMFYRGHAGLKYTRRRRA